MKLPIVSSAKVIKALTSVGFSISRQSGSHVILTKHGGDSKITVVVPKRNELAKGTLLSIISQTEMSKEEFIGFLE